MVAGENPQAAGVNRNRLVQAELGGEIRHRPRPQHAGMLDAPRPLRRQVLLHPAVGVVDPAVQRELRCALLQVVDVDALEQRDRVVGQLAPQHRIQVAEQVRRVLVPAPPQVLRQLRQALVRRRDEQAQCPRLADDRSQLRAGRFEPLHGVGPEGPRLERLDDQHALQQSAILERHAEERLVRVLAGLTEVLEARMRRRVLDDLRLHLLADEADEALRQPHPHLADALGPEADGRREDERRSVGLEQVDRADVGAEPLLDQPNDVGEGFSRVAALGDQPGDLIEAPQRVIGGRCTVSHSVVTG